jgi:phytoene synthase
VSARTWPPAARSCAGLEELRLRAARLLPAVRDPATALYAFLRIADDLVDADPAASADTIAALRRRLAAMYQGQPLDHPVDRSLALAIVRHGLPHGVFDAFLEGLQWDVSGRRYRTFDDLCEYASRVAGTVGVLMALLMGERTTAMLSRACDLGIAMQLTNIARDVGEDAGRGRLYLPLDWLERAGIDPQAFLGQPRYSPALGGVVRRLLDEADRFLRQRRRRHRWAALRLPGGDPRRALHLRRDRRYVARAGFDSVTGGRWSPGGGSWGWRRARSVRQSGPAGATLSRRGHDGRRCPGSTPCTDEHHGEGTFARIACWWAARSGRWKGPWPAPRPRAARRGWRRRWRGGAVGRIAGAGRSSAC